MEEEDRETNSVDRDALRFIYYALRIECHHYSTSLYPCYNPTNREELSVYLTSSRQRLSSSSLVHFPANFDAIANSMTREDLHLEANEDDEGEDWCRTLLADRFALDAAAEFEGGRYKTLFAREEYHLHTTAAAVHGEGEVAGRVGQEESRRAYLMKKGMAEIALLDRQLRLMNR